MFENSYIILMTYKNYCDIQICSRSPTTLCNPGHVFLRFS